jgi:AbrB family looped-hinge helix DNA binding protein
MERLTTSMDQHGRMLIPSHIRQMLNIHPGEKITLEIDQDNIRVINANHVIDEMHALFTKNQSAKNDSVVDDFINQKRQEHSIEESRDIKNVKNSI